jgi:uridine phosphorylase
MKKKYPILEYDPARRAVAEPHLMGAGRKTLPKHCVLCFFREEVRKLRGKYRILASLGSEMGMLPVYGLKQGRRTVAVMQAPVGAALAGGLFDELIALGAKKFVVVGGAGVLDRNIAFGHVVVPTSAVRDEGTSYHYLPPSREVAPSRKAVSAIRRVLARNDIPFVTGKTWTTDGFYRETHAKVKMRRAEGCVTVEMEAAALFAVARFRGVHLGQMLYGGDDVSGEEWDKRKWGKRHEIRGRLFRLAVEACMAM